VFSALCEHSVVDCVLVVHRVAHSVSVALNVSVGLSVSVADSEDAVVKCVCTNVCVPMSVYQCVSTECSLLYQSTCYWVATTSRLLQIISLFCRISSYL